MKESSSTQHGPMLKSNPLLLDHELSRSRSSDWKNKETIHELQSKEFGNSRKAVKAIIQKCETPGTVTRLPRSSWLLRIIPKPP